MWTMKEKMCSIGKLGESLKPKGMRDFFCYLTLERKQKIPNLNFNKCTRESR